MKGGTVFWLVIALLAVAAIALLLLRPARVVGVGDEALAYSLRSAAGRDATGTCRERDERWLCTLAGEPEARPRAIAAYSVDAGDWGCWDAKLLMDGVAGEGGEDSRGSAEGAGSAPRTLDGCITIADLVRSGD